MNIFNSLSKIAQLARSDQSYLFLFYLFIYLFIICKKINIKDFFSIIIKFLRYGFVLFFL